MMSNSKKLIVLDWIVIILEMSYGLSLLMQVFYLIPSLGILIPMLIFIFVCHNLRFGIRFHVIKLTTRSPILLIFFLILFFDLIQAVLYSTNTSTIGVSLARVINNFFFFSYLYNLCIDRGIDYVIKPFLGYSIYNLCVIALMAILIVAGISWQQNQLPSDIPLIADNAKEGQGGTYYFPYFLSVASQFYGYSIFPSIPGLTGLSHEPNTIMWIVTPAVFLSLSYKNIKPLYKCIVVALLIFTLSITLSATALVTFFIILILQIIWLGIYSKQKIYSCGLFVLIIMVLVLFADTRELILDILKTKGSMTGESSGSLEYSSNMVRYILSFDSILGYGNLPPVEKDRLGSVTAGAVSGGLDFLLFSIMMTSSIKLFLNRNGLKHYFGLAFLYLLIHGIKVGFGVFGYPFFSFFVFIIFYINITKGKALNHICRIKKNSL